MITLEYTLQKLAFDQQAILDQVNRGTIDRYDAAKAKLNRTMSGDFGKSLSPPLSINPFAARIGNAMLYKGSVGGSTQPRYNIADHRMYNANTAQLYNNATDYKNKLWLAGKIWGK